MKANKTLLVALAITLSATVQSRAQAGPSALSKLEEAGKIIGQVVVDTQNQKVGRVKELAVDWQAGRVVEILIDTGGFLTSHGRIVAIPPETLAAMESGDGLRMTGDVDEFENAPEFDQSRWKDTTGAAAVADVYERFHVHPYGQVTTLEPSSKIVGLAIRNQHNQRLGKVETLVVKLPGGTIPDVIVASKGFLGGGKLTAVPPQAFYFAPEYNAMILDTTREALRDAPHFRADDWRTGINKPISISVVYDSLNVLHSPAYQQGGTAMDDPAPNHRDDMQTDITITLEIEHKIMATEGLSIDARNTHVYTLRGYVTLHGIADSEKEKATVGEIAATVVPPDHVSNLILVRVFAAR